MEPISFISDLLRRSGGLLGTESWGLGLTGPSTLSYLSAGSEDRLGIIAMIEGEKRVELPVGVRDAARAHFILICGLRPLRLARLLEGSRARAHTHMDG